MTEQLTIYPYALRGERLEPISPVACYAELLIHFAAGGNLAQSALRSHYRHVHTLVRVA